MSLIRAHFQGAAAALAYFSRIPLPRRLVISDADLNLGLAYLPWIGLIVALGQVSVIYFAQLVLPMELAVFLAIACGIWLTGGLHEDGLADCADGFGGGLQDKERILTIMKDPRLGTYGALALIIVLGWRYLSLSEMDLVPMIQAIILAQVISRCCAVFLAWSLPYARPIENNKSSFQATYLHKLIAGAPLLIFMLLISPHIFASILVASLLLTLIVRHKLKKILKGYTGDTLGGSQQITEALIYGLFLILWP